MPCSELVPPQNCRGTLTGGPTRGHRSLERVTLQYSKRGSSPCSTLEPCLSNASTLHRAARAPYRHRAWDPAWPGDGDVVGVGWGRGWEGVHEMARLGGEIQGQKQGKGYFGSQILFHSYPLQILEDVTAWLWKACIIKTSVICLRTTQGIFSKILPSREPFSSLFC